MANLKVANLNGHGARLLQSFLFFFFFSIDSKRRTLTFSMLICQMKEAKRIPRNASKLFQRVLPFGFLLFKRSLQNWMSVKVPFSIFFNIVRLFSIFFVSKGSLPFYLTFRYSADLRRSSLFNSSWNS